jgi:hypothetical protein
MPAGPVAYVTDIEGQWERLEGFVARTDGVRLEGTSLVLADGWTLVFGGDAIDRGPWSRRVVRTLLEARRRYGARVVLIGGNRDLNKTRLVRELCGHPPARAPAELHGDRAALLKFIFQHTMGASEAFRHRAAELAAEGLPSGDAAVVDSLLADLGPGGDLAAYLAEVQLAYRHGETLFLHGGLTEESLGHVPGQASVADVDGWIDALNRFCAEQVARFLERDRAGAAPPSWQGIIAYQAPAPGQPTNPASVVYGRLSDALNNPSLPPRAVVSRLAAAGVRRLVLGHTPSGDTPAVLRTEGFELVIADNSRGRVATGSGVTIDGPRLEVRAEAVLDGGERVEVAFARRLDDDGGPGLRAREDGRLVKGPTTDGRVTLYRGRPGHVLEQLAVAPDDPRLAGLEEPWPA